MGKSLIFDPKLMGRFRDKFSEGGFGRLRYRNRDGKDDFSAICSSMDWIEVAIDYINSFTLSKNRDNIISMEAFSFIMAVYLIYSCITTMHKVIFNAPKEIPFNDSHEIFNLEKSDNEHVKNIRAAFGAHPTDITKINKGEIQYASWSLTRSGEYDFAVYLYSSIPYKRAELYGFNVDDLILFAKKRYEYLEKLINELEKQSTIIRNELIRKQIDKSVKLKERIEILKKEAMERYGRGLYDEALNDINTMLNAPCSFKSNKRTVDKYKKQLNYAIDNIENNLQNMEFEQLPSLTVVYPEYRPEEVSYDIQKVYEGIEKGGWYRQMIPYNLKRIKPYLKGIRNITPGLSSDELMVLVNSGLYFAGINKNKDGTYSGG